MKVAKYFSSKPKKTILEDNPKSIDDYDREMLQQFCWDAEHGIEDDEIDETVKLFMEWRNRRAKAYADEVKPKWVSILDRLPICLHENQKAFDILILAENDRYYTGYAVEEYSKTTFHQHNGRKILKVTHWRPLPKKPLNK